ncbi:MAG TPA: Gfo/Idh/MocA family oxidoreductase [Candidatus Bathyarchaeia archaeon]|nr:Gfo/Idh/MocA family oxidoreductase [Candidatus Bathyarchaeia archaeon]
MDAMNRLGMAVIGTGFWGRNHSRILSDLDNVNLACVYDLNPVRAKSVAEQFNVQFSSNLDDVLSRKDISAVTICTPTTTHTEIAKKALKAGKHVLVEKPMTNTISEAQEILSLADREGLRIMPGHIERFNPAVNYLRSLVDDRRLGSVILLLARRVGRWPERIGDVGVVRDTAIHDVDIARFIFNDEVGSIYARVGSLKHTREDYAEIMLQFVRGGTAFIDANWLAPRKTRTVVVTGSDATVQLDYITQEISIEDSEKITKPNIPKQEPLRNELSHFATSILSDDPFAVTGTDGLRAVEICELVLQSARTGQAVSLVGRTVA